MQDGRFQKVTLTGTVEEVTTDLEPLKELLLAKVPKASMYMHYTDFTWFKMNEIAGVHFITDAVSGNPTVGEVIATTFATPVAPICAPRRPITWLRAPIQHGHFSRRSAMT